MQISFSEFSSQSNTFILLSTFVVVTTTTVLLLIIGSSIIAMFRRGNTNRSNSTSTNSSTSTAAGSPPVRKSTWGFPIPTNASGTGRVKAAAAAVNEVSLPPRKNSFGLPSVRGGSSRPGTPSSAKSGTTNASVASKPSKPSLEVKPDPPVIQKIKKDMEDRIAELSSQIVLVRAQVDERENRLTLSSRQVDDVRDDLESVTKELEDMRGQNARLTGDHAVRERELLSLKASHDKLRTLYASTAHALETRETELDAERHRSDALCLGSLTDKMSSSDVVSHLHGLNENVRSIAGFMADQFDLSIGTYQTAPDFTSEDMEEAKVRAEEILGSRMVQLLMQTSKQKNSDSLAELVRFAFQAGICAYGEWMVSSWMFEDPGKEGVLNAVYESMRKTESATLLGLWKATTRKHGQKSTLVPTTDLAIYFIDALINVLIVSGFRATHMSLHSHITGNYPEKINQLVQDATRLNKSIGEDVVEYDLEMVHIPPDTTFDPLYMEDAMGKAKLTKGKKGQDKVLCTLDLGLLRLVKSPTTNKWENRVLVKPRVLLQSSV